ELGDVRFVELGYVRDHYPVAREIGFGEAPDSRKRLALDFPEPREVDLRPRRQLERCGCARAFLLRHRALDEGLDVAAKDAAIQSGALDPGKIDAEFARELAHRRTGVRLAPRGWSLRGRIDRDYICRRRRLG